MTIATLFAPLRWALMAVGVASLALAALLAVPLRQPPPLASIETGALAIDQSGRAERSRFQARDGSWLAYRLYPADEGAATRLAILAHGSSASSDEMTAVARVLAANGVAAVAMDVRGHGASGTRGDIGYLGQLDDDLADLVGELRKTYPEARLALLGHSAGGGFVLRVAAEPLGALFDHFILLAPYLGYDAPTNQPTVGPGHWAEPDIPRIVALAVLSRLGIDWGQSLPAIAFANDPKSAKFVTSRYSFRLLANYGPPPDWKAAFARTVARMDVIVGEADELMIAAAYPDALKPYAGRVSFTALAGVDHMGVVSNPAALAAVVAALKR